MIEITNDNYFSPEAMREYWSVSQFKSFNKCEECGLAELNGDYERPETDALLIGSYVDAYFSGELKEFIKNNGSKMVKKDGKTLLAKFEQANIMIKRVEADPLMREFLKGEKQVIRTGELFGVPWKIKIDVLNEKRIVDVKAVKDFEDVYDPAYGSKRSWIEYWGYDIQGAIYQKIEQITSGRPEPLPFYLEAVTKEKVGSVPEPDIKIVQLPQHILDAALKLVEAKIDRLDLIKQGEVEPIRCERCAWCKRTKILRAPEIYEIREA